MSESRLTFTLHRIVALLDRHADLILRKAMNMTYSQFLFLVKLAEESGTSGSALAQRLGLSRAAVSKRLPWFESHGLVVVRDDEHHGRIRRMYLTEKGAARLEEASMLLENAFRMPAKDTLSFDLDDLHDHLLELQATLEATLPRQGMAISSRKRKDS